MGTDPDEMPFASIVIPVYDDPEGIEVTLESVVEQTYPADRYEILPVDNGSTDSTGAVIAAFVATHPDVLTALEETEVQSSYAARNRGIEEARGDLLVFLDADMSVGETWLERLVEAVDTDECAYLGYRVEVETDDVPTIWERYERALSFPVETYVERNNFAPTCALVVRRDVIDEVGRFDERLVSGGDKEFGHRVHRAGFEQDYVDDVTASHPARDSLGALRAKAIRIGRGRAQIRRHHPDIDGYPHPLHPINYLPPSPFRLRRRFSGTESTSALVQYYVLEYVLKLFQTYGTLREAIAMHRSNGEGARS